MMIRVIADEDAPLDFSFFSSSLSRFDPCVINKVLESTFVTHRHDRKFKNPEYPWQRSRFYNVGWGCSSAERHGPRLRAQSRQKP